MMKFSYRSVNKVCLFFFLQSLLLTSKLCFSGILGSFAKVRNLPGYIDLDPKSEINKGYIPKKYLFEGIENRTPSRLLQDFLTNKRKFNIEKAKTFINKIKDYKKNAFLTFCSVSLPHDISTDSRFCLGLDWTVRKNKLSDIDSLKDLYKEWFKNKAYIACEIAINNMKKSIIYSENVDFNNINDESNINFIESFFKSIEAFEGIKGEDAQWGKTSSNVKYYTKILSSYSKEISICSDREEAVNLLVPENMKENSTGSYFFSPDMLKSLKNRGFDISKLNPPDSGLWRMPTTAPKYWDPRTYNKLAIKDLEKRHTQKQVKDMLDPMKEISVTYVPRKHTRGESPKIIVRYGKKQKWKLKFLTDKHNANSLIEPIEAIKRIIVSSEVNVEPAVNNIAAMLGFTIDPTYYKEKVRMYLPDEVYETGDFHKYLEEEILFPLSQNFKRV